MTPTLKPISLPEIEETDAEFTKALMTSFIETGFAIIENHGLDQTIIDEALEASRAFFSLPEDTKLGYFDPDGGGQRGYTPFGKENAKGVAAIDLKEFWHTGRDLPTGHKDSVIMPDTPHVDEVRNFDQATRNLFSAFDTLGQRLLRSIARGLELEENWFLPKVKEGNSILRLLHYPAQPTPPTEGSVRAAAHEDINVITLLLGADEAGLQVRPRGVEEWISVEAPKGSVVINVGDMLQRQTNHVLQSTSHRVVNPAPERSRFSRYSMPFFLHFAPDVEIRSLAQCVTTENSDRYPDPITANEYLLERLREIGLIRP